MIPQIWGVFVTVTSYLAIIIEEIFLVYGVTASITISACACARIAIAHYARAAAPGGYIAPEYYTLPTLFNNYRHLQTL